MHCDEFRTRLNAELDQRRLPQRDSQLGAHARHCSDCAEWMAVQSALLSAVGGLATIELPADFGLQVLQRLEVDVRRRHLVRRRWASGVALALAAGLLIAILPWRHSNPLRPGQDQQGGLNYALLAQQTRHLATNLTAHQLVLMDEVAQGLKPVTNSVYTALQTLWSTVPGSELAQTLQ